MALNEELRNRILDDLSAQFSRDRISIDDYEQRVQAVHAARDDLELLNVNSDILPPAKYNQGRAQPASRASSGDVRINYGEVPASRNTMAVFSGSDIRGEFQAPRRMDSIAIFGGIHMDLRDALIPADGMTIEAVALFGGVEIILPEGVNLEVHGSGIFGGFSSPGAAMTQGPTIRVTGAAIFGGVDVRRKRRKN